MISDTELKQVVYAFKCNNSTLQVKGKINSIIVGLYTLPAVPPLFTFYSEVSFVNASTDDFINFKFTQKLNLKLYQT